MKQIISITLLVVVLLALGGNVFAAKEEKLTFAFSVMVFDNPYFISVIQGFRDRCDELGIECIVNDAKYDAGLQFNQVETYITSGVDAICIAPIDQRSLADVVERAKEKEIVVISEAQPIDKADANIIVHEYDYGFVGGTNAAKWINEVLGGEAEVAIISQDNVEAVIARANGIEDAIKKFAPNAKIISRQSGDTPERAIGIAEAVLQAHPNVKVFQCVNDSGAIGAYEAVRGAGKATADFYVGGADATEEALSRMKEEGSVYRSTIDIDPYGTGKKCVDVMLDYVKNSVKNETFYFDMVPVWQENALKE